jgi:hypothetical protein
MILKHKIYVGIAIVTMLCVDSFADIIADGVMYLINLI